MDGLGDSLLHGTPEQDDDPNGGLRRAEGGAVFPGHGCPHYDETLYRLVEEVTGVGAMYQVAAPEDGETIVNVVAWHDPVYDLTRARVVCWPCQN